jgi:hypothetical protein
MVDERLPATAAAPGTFEPDAGLVREEADRTNASPGDSPRLPRVTLGAQALARLQVDAFFLLNQVGATLGEQVSVDVEAGGVAVRALVDGQARKRELSGHCRRWPAFRACAWTSGRSTSPRGDGAGPARHARGTRRPRRAALRPRETPC